MSDDNDNHDVLLQDEVDGEESTADAELEDAGIETTAEGAEGEAGAEGEGSPKKGKKKLVFIAGGAALLILIVVGVLVSGVLGGGKKTDEHGVPIEAELSPEEKAAKDAAAALAAKPVYYELPEFLVNLNATGSRVSGTTMTLSNFTCSRNFAYNGSSTSSTIR